MSHVDLHCHSTASDGSLTPAEVVRLAKEAGLTGLALTDHDTVAGVPEAAEEARRLGVDFITGIEISSEFPRPGTMHLLGYGVDPHNATLHELTRTLIDGRTQRNVKIVENLNGQGVAITVDEVLAEARGGTVGRPHFAAVLVRKGYVGSVQQAFDRYLGQTGSAYADKEVVTPRRAIEMIRAAGGLAVLAHPAQLKRDNFAQIETIVRELVGYGLRGVEVLHSDHKPPLVDQLYDLARRLDLVPTGGSDFHGRSKPTITLGAAGQTRVPRELFDGLKARLTTGGQGSVAGCQ